MKIVMTSGAVGGGTDPDFLEELHAEFPDVTFLPVADAEEGMRLIRDADAIYGWPTQEMVQVADKLSWVHIPGTGVDEMGKRPALIEHDAVLTNCRGPHAPPMADHVMGMVINLAHRWGDLFADQRDRTFEMLKYAGTYKELAGSTMGILSMGDIGTEVARRAHGFGINVYAADVHPMAPPPEVKEVWGLERLDELLGMCDWFVVAAPLTPQSRDMIDRRRIGLMKQGAFVIVISRGNIVDEQALADAVRSGRLGGAGIDAFATEPLPQDSPLWGLDNVVLTPHASALTPDLVVGRRNIFKENLRRRLAGEPFLYVVDKKAGF